MSVPGNRTLIFKGGVSCPGHPLADFRSYQMKKRMNALMALVAAHWQVFIILVLRSCILVV